MFDKNLTFVFRMLKGWAAILVNYSEDGSLAFNNLSGYRSTYLTKQNSRVPDVKESISHLQDFAFFG